MLYIEKMKHFVTFLKRKSQIMKEQCKNYAALTFDFLTSSSRIVELSLHARKNNQWGENSKVMSDTASCRIPDHNTGVLCANQLFYKSISFFISLKKM